MQQTVKKPVTFSGVGLHTGADITMTVYPAPADHGVVFKRVDLVEAGAAALLPARWDMVEHFELCTLLKNDQGHSVSTIEHIMSALCGCGIDNALIEIDGPEVPIMDGSSLKFVSVLVSNGIVIQHRPRKALRIVEAVEVEENGKKAAFVPSHIPVYTFTIDFPGTAIGRQDLTFEHTGAESYCTMIAGCRTFAKLEEIEYLRSKGLIKGGSLENALVVDKDTVVNGPLRFKDEFVRHKILDAMGDVALSGHLMIGHFISSKGGHALTNKLLRKLFDTPQAYRLEDCYAEFEGLQDLPRSVGGKRKVFSSIS